MSAIRKPRAPRLKTYRVLYSVRRDEWYEIKAPDEETAGRKAFWEGELFENCDVTDVAECEVEEVKP
jgi:hypothetical protein